MTDLIAAEINKGGVNLESEPLLNKVLLKFGT